MGDRNALRDRVLTLRILDEALCETIRSKISNLEEREAAIATAKLHQQRRQQQLQLQQQNQQRLGPGHTPHLSQQPGSYGSHQISFQSSNYSTRYHNQSAPSAAGVESRVFDLEGLSVVPSAQSSSSSYKHPHRITPHTLSSDSDTHSQKPDDPTLWTFHCDDKSYPARLSNLPCPVELHKTRDRRLYHKCVNIAQILVVYSSPEAMQQFETQLYPRLNAFPSYHPSGLTPPMGKVLENRLAKREHACVPPPREEIMEVEKELMELIKRVNKDGGGKKNAGSKSGGGNSATVVEIEDEVVQYEPWMDNDGTGVGVEFTEDDELCLQHPELWLDPDEMGAKEEEERGENKDEEGDDLLSGLMGGGGLEGDKTIASEETKKKKKSKNSSSPGKKKSNKKKKSGSSGSKNNQTSAAVNKSPQTQTDYAQQIAQDMLQNKDDEIDLDFFDFDNEDDFLGGDGALGL